MQSVVSKAVMLCSSYESVYGEDKYLTCFCFPPEGFLLWQSAETVNIPPVLVKPPPSMYMSHHCRAHLSAAAVTTWQPVSEIPPLHVLNQLSCWRRAQRGCRDAASSLRPHVPARSHSRIRFPKGWLEAARRCLSVDEMLRHFRKNEETPDRLRRDCSKESQ